MRILVTNDDGIAAEGIFALAQVAAEFGDVAIVAPNYERSACGHGLTMREPLRIKPIDGLPCRAWQTTGFPTDCVNLGRMVAWPDGVDLVLSGFNHGPNLGFDISYSGTVAAAMEGCINGILSVAVSMAVFVEGAPLHLDSGRHWFAKVLAEILAMPSKPLRFWNVNIPAIAESEILGIRYCSMGQRVYPDRMEVREDPWGRPYYWQGGVAAMHEDQPDTDVNAIRDQFVSVTPITMNWTDQCSLSELAGPQTE
ncbi:MAG: 5'/3'-nucleotidase SurE [Chthonomonas sp.]|nr:5'/3'-nucleotidase SurE [Chthonomonas sp.]